MKTKSRELLFAIYSPQSYLGTLHSMTAEEGGLLAKYGKGQHANGPGTYRFTIEIPLVACAHCKQDKVDEWSRDMYGQRLCPECDEAYMRERRDAEKAVRAKWGVQ